VPATLLASAHSAQATPTCPIESPAIEDAKPNKLYLFMPSADDSGFPESGCTINTPTCFSSGDPASISPARTFDITQLTDYHGTSADLQSGIFDVVTDDYCEFNVKVLTTNTVPATTFPNRVTVAIGTDTPSTSGLFGIAQEVDIGDSLAVDFARTWGGTYQSLSGTGTSGQELAGANSTVQRWAFALGGTAAHEAGHTFGLSHADGAVVKPGEPDVTTHIMPAGGLVPLSARAGFRRHFDDTTFGILAANVGLSVETLHNFDFTNPNGVSASSLQLQVLSTSPSLTLSWFYNGNLSPWTNPTVSGATGTRSFKGTTYNVFTLTFSTGQTWANGSPGTVPAAASFHVGAAFSEADFTVPNSIIVSNVTLFDAANNALTLHPRMVGYDAGALDAASGGLDLGFFNVDNAAAPLIVSDVVVQELPRVLSLQNMVQGGPMTSFDGVPVLPWKSTKMGLRAPLAGDTQHLRLAALSQGRHIFNKYSGQCGGTGSSGGSSGSPPPPGDSIFDPEGVNDCPSKGTSLDLFPSTTAFVTATVTDPNARHWDPVSSQYVVGPVVSRVYFQLAGRHPDLNRNGIDDAIDIDNGTSNDTSPPDGVPDEVQRCLTQLGVLDTCELEKSNLTVKRGEILREQGLVLACEASKTDCCPVAGVLSCEDEGEDEGDDDARERCRERRERHGRHGHKGHEHECDEQLEALADELREIDAALAKQTAECSSDVTSFQSCTGIEVVGVSRSPLEGDEKGFGGGGSGPRAGSCDVVGVGAQLGGGGVSALGLISALSLLRRRRSSAKRGA
jgi:hypothetical protein